MKVLSLRTLEFSKINFLVGVGLGLHAEEDLVHHAEGRGTGGLGADLEGGQGLDQEAEDLDPIL